ncbi:hypothetical protein NLB33_25975 [Mycolicibacterium smegmatis]|uniref:hypothetical protein n=1 Tax=Mycolicibacterium smegmatis TaxID=1772 RepID=UPI0020A5F2A3|nr:hypothetical protein [Mycolicibacterium smegmatis]MCP2625527.1 hypothetical protein [Mycolicibacterium smegmatis]MCP2626296.1 hypothetical protein [Mycolicibacterium smegmatis]
MKSTLDKAKSRWTRPERRPKGTTTPDAPARPVVTRPDQVAAAPEPTPPTTRDGHRQSLTAIVREAHRPERRLTLAPRTAHAVAATPAAPPSDEAPLAPVASTAAVQTTPTPPQPLSPAAQLRALPGRVVNAVLDVLDFTSSANSPTLPVSLAPVNDLIFGTFREIERLMGLHDTPPEQPVVPAMVYDGPTDRPTPTVAQFLNASTAAYVLGATPGGLKPFAVDGEQMQSTDIVSGMVGKAWVTPEGQIIIAYQGTTGGSHLLFNPIIVIPQVIADLQVVFTGTTPLAFHDALDFAQQVRAEAARQGYSDDDIFVTGHSLGGWEAQYVAQQTGLAGIGFEAPGINTTVPGNGADSMFVNIGTYGSSAPYMATDLPGLQPFMPPYVPGGGSKPHYGPIVMIGDPAAMTPLYNASTLWGTSVTGSVIFLVDYLMNFFQYHLPGVQAYHLDVTPDPGVVPFLGTARGPVHEGYGELTIPELLARASDDGILFQP